MSRYHGEKGAIEITWRPERTLATPIYMQIVNYFVSQIASGVWIAGDTLPSQRKLSLLFDVNRSSIVGAMDILTSMGLIESSYGGGTKVSDATYSTLIGKKTLDWKKYVSSGKSLPNKQFVQIINHAESLDSMVRLGTGELDSHLLGNDILKEVLARLSKKSDSLISYPSPVGSESLRIALCNHLEQYGIHTTPDCILIVSGAIQALQLIASGIVTDRSKVYLAEPSYLNSLKLFQSSGATLEAISTDRDGILPWTIKNLDQHARRSILYSIPTYHNPTTAVMPLSRRTEVFHFCKEHRLPIVEDDVFCDLWLENPPPPPIKSMDTSGNVVYIGSVSKSFAPGLRIGWLVGPPALIRRLSDIKMQMDYGASSLSQSVTCELLESNLYSQAMARIRPQLLERRNIMLAMLDLYFSDLATWSVPMGGYYLWVTLKVKVPVERIFLQALQSNILLTPGSIYDKKAIYNFRLNYGYSSPEVWSEFLPKLAQIIRSNIPF